MIDHFNITLQFSNQFFNTIFSLFQLDYGIYELAHVMRLWYLKHMREGILYINNTHMRSYPEEQKV